MKTELSVYPPHPDATADGRTPARSPSPAPVTGAPASRTAALLGRWWLKLLLASTLGIAHRAAAQQDANPPNRLSYQGFLADADGNALSPTTPENYAVVFRLFDAPTGGTLLWSEQQDVTVDKGYFSVSLGEGNQYASESHGALSGLFDHPSASDRYIETTVTINGTPTKLLPRLRLVPSPYAFVATKARTAATALSVELPGGAGFTTAEGGSLELGPGVGTNQVPYIDFHFGSRRPDDYNVRLINDGDGVLSLRGLNNAPGTLAVFGKVGIGTAVPAYPLHVVGAVNATEYRLNGNPLAASAWQTAPNGIYYASGNAGIGIGAAPQANVRLDVQAANGSHGIYVRGNGAAISHFLDVGSAGQGVLGLTDGSAQRTVISGGGNSFFTGGNVGIGTANPGQNTLQVGERLEPADGYGLVVSRPDYGMNVQISRNWGAGGIGLLVDNVGYGNQSTRLLLVRNNSLGGGSVPANTALDVAADAGGHSYVGIGTPASGFPLRFADLVGGKISLYGGSGNSYGFGIQASVLQVYTPQASQDIVFGYGTSEALTETMRIKGTGNVGIGTASPGANKLQVGTPPLSANGYGLVVAHPAYGANIQVNHGSSGGIGLIVDNAGAGGMNTSLLQVRNNGAAQTVLDVRGVASSNSGHVGIGRLATDQFALAVQGRAYKSDGNVGWAITSDARLKQNVQPMTNAVEQLSRLRGVTFEWIHPEDHGGEAGRQGGFIAQEVERAFPDWVGTAPAGQHEQAYSDNGRIKSLDLKTEFQALLVEAIKELRSDLEAKAAKIESLESRLAVLEARDKARAAEFAALESLVREQLGGVQQASLRTDRAAGNQ